MNQEMEIYNKPACVSKEKTPQYVVCRVEIL